MEKKSCQRVINNSFYDELSDDWYTKENHPIALLRAENQVRVPWIAQEIKNSCQRVLDIGCGGGFLTNALALKGHEVFGIDLSSTSLEVAQRKDATQKVRYQVANAYDLPFENESFDVVCAMDILEHVENPQKVIEEASRVLKKNGMFFFHTFNRNFFSYLIIIKGVDWFTPNAPTNMHVYSLFIKPKEMKKMLQKESLEIGSLRGFRPKIWSKELFKLVFRKKISPTFPFCFSKSLLTGYSGWARKKETV